MLILQQSVQPSAVTDSLSKRVKSQYELHPGDIIDIKVSSLDPSSVAIFNKSVGIAANTAVNEASLYVNGYMIDNFGEINLPLIGEVPVYGITLDSLNSLLDQKLSGYFKYYTVEAKLVNYRVSILGEVKRAGTQIVYNSDLNLLQALSNAGGVNDHGNRKKVKVIRKAFGQNEAGIVDLTDDAVMQNKYFYLMPNDVIYVEPYRSKAVSINVPMFALLISALSLPFLIFSTVSK